MSSGGYNELHSSASYGHGDSWRPSGSSSGWSDRDAYYDRHPASPGRQYSSYDGYYAQEESYRPNSYRSEDDDPYYSVSPSPEHYSRYSRPLDAWESAEPWTSVPAPWDDPIMVSVSPASPAPKARKDPMMATRMFEPSDSWKQNHTEHPSRTDRHSGDSLQTRAPNSYYPNGHHPSGDSYRPTGSYREAYPRSDSYRPGPGWSERHRRSSNASLHVKVDTNRPDDRSRRVSGSASILSSGSPRRPSSSNGRTQSRRSRSRSLHSSSRSVTRSTSRGRSRSANRCKGDRSLSRGRPLVHRLTTTAGGSSLSSPKKEASNGKYIWNRPISVSKTAPGAKLTMPSKALPPAQSLQKSSWTRSGSRSSIASTQASDSSPRPVALVSADAKQPAPLSIANDKENKDAVVKPADVEMAPPVLTTTPSVMKPIVVSAASVKSDRTQVSFAHPVSCPPEAKALQPPTVAKSQTTTVQSVPSPLLLDGSSTPQSQFEVANAVKAVPAAIELSSTVLMPETLPVSNIDGKQHLLASTPSSASRIATVASLADSSQKRHHDEHKAILSAVSLPTPVLTPQHTPGSERPSSPARPESLPTEAKSLRDALRIVAMTRLLCDRQTLEERIEPVLLNNQALAALAHQDEPSSTSQEIMKEVTGGQRHDQRMEKFNLIKGSLAERFKERQNALTKKVKLLKEEYLSLHERWLAHCAVLDEQNRPIAPEPEIVQPAGRTTRRTANLGDAVRSDLEMEQIIASLGNDDATDPNHLSLRNLATIPDMISVTRGSIDYTFDDTNHFIENPSDYYGPHTGIHDWTKSEKEIFLDKFAAHPKQFGMIAEHLPNKTAAQCVDYYYLHKKKHIDFRKVVSQYAPNKRKRGRTGKKKGNGLLADIRQHDAEIHGETGSPRSSGRPSRGRKPMLPPDAKEPKRASTSRRRNPLDLTPSVSATPTPEPETRRRGGRRSAAAPLSRTVSVSLDDNEEEATEEVSERPAKRAKRGSRRVIKSAATVVDDSSALDVKTVELAESISRRKPGGSSAQWSDEDKNLFLGLLAQHGDNFKRIAASMPNRTTIQVSNFFKANCDELGLEAVAASAPKRSLTPDATTDETRGPTPSGAATPATDIYDEPMASLTPDPPHANGAQKPLSEIESKTTFAWGPSAPRQATPPIPASHVQGGYYPLNGRGAPYYHPPHPMPATYGQPVPYPYAHYTAPRYSPYDPSQMPYAMPDPTHHTHMPIRSTDNPFPVLPQSGQATYPYSESS